MKYLLELILAIGLFYILKEVVILAVEVAFFVAIAFFLLATYAKHKVYVMRHKTLLDKIKDKLGL